MTKTIFVLSMTFFCFFNLIASKFNRDIFLEEIKLLREDPGSFIKKVETQWKEYFTLGSIDSKIHVDHMKKDFEFLKEYLLQKGHQECEFNCFFQFDNNLINLANFAARISANNKKILDSASLNKLILSFGEKYQKNKNQKQMKYYKIYGISFEFSEIIEHLTDVLVLMLIQSSHLRKSHIQAIANSEYNYLGMHFEKKDEIIYGVLLLADKRVV